MFRKTCINNNHIGIPIDVFQNTNLDFKKQNNVFQNTNLDFEGVFQNANPDLKKQRKKQYLLFKT